MILRASVQVCKKRNRIIFTLLQLVLMSHLVSCTKSLKSNTSKTLSASQLACKGFEIENRNKLFWSKGFPIQLHINQDFPKDKMIALDQAIYIWNTTFGFEIFKPEVLTVTSDVPLGDQKNIIYWLNQWKMAEIKNATTLLYVVKGNILEADIILNAENYSLSADSPKIFETDLTSLLLHELGHMLGLAHEDDQKDSIMKTVLNEGEERLSLSEYDINNINCMY